MIDPETGQGPGSARHAAPRRSSSSRVGFQGIGNDIVRRCQRHRSVAGHGRLGAGGRATIRRIRSATNFQLMTALSAGPIGGRQWKAGPTAARRNPLVTDERAELGGSRPRSARRHGRRDASNVQRRQGRSGRGRSRSARRCPRRRPTHRRLPPANARRPPLADSEPRKPESRVVVHRRLGLPHQQRAWACRATATSS